MRRGQFTAKLTAQEPTEVQSAEVQPAEVQSVETQAVEVQTVEAQVVDAQAAEDQAVDIELPPLDTDLEHTRLTRRELRARRGTNPHLNDAPKHLPPIAPPPLPAESADEPLSELDIPPMQVAEEPSPEPSAERQEGSSRRWRIVRLSVLLGILAVVSSVGVLTAGTL